MKTKSLQKIYTTLPDDGKNLCDKIRKESENLNNLNLIKNNELFEAIKKTLGGLKSNDDILSKLEEYNDLINSFKVKNKVKL